jgi:hypothetical protein
VVDNCLTDVRYVGTPPRIRHSDCLLSPLVQAVSFAAGLQLVALADQPQTFTNEFIQGARVLVAHSIYGTDAHEICATSDEFRQRDPNQNMEIGPLRTVRGQLARRGKPGRGAARRATQADNGYQGVRSPL